MNSPSQGRYALVTGGSKGIGFAICQRLLAAGFDVIIAARRREAACRQTSLAQAKAAAEQLQSAESKVHAVELDVADDQSIDKAVNHVSQEIPYLDVLVNNAGIYPDEGVNILTISRELLNRTMNTNAFGAILVSQAFLPLLEKARAARIINVSSGYGQLSGLSSNVPSYCLSKLTLNGTTIMLADALHAKGIAVNAIDPGWVKTDMGGTSAPRSPEQVADTAVWLATEASPSLTGKLWHDRKEISY